MIVIDYTTKFLDIQSLPDKLSNTITQRLKSTFAKFDIPQIMMSDGCPEFKSDTFQKFAKNWDFKHNQSSGIYLQSNGLMALLVGFGVLQHTMRKT